LEQIRFSAHNAILPPWYYMFRLYEDRHRANAPAYLHRFETKQGVYRILKQSYRDDKQMKGLLTNKVEFAAHCVRNGLAAVATLAFVEDERLTWNVPDERLPSVDLFLKPNFGRGGQGAERWDYVEPDSFRNNRTGEVRSQGELIAYLQDLSKEQSYIVQPRVRNHPDLIDLSNGVLLTCRLVTLRNEQGGHEMTDGVLRMAIGNNTLVDNLHAGGISAPIDRATGVLGRATDVGAKVGRGWIDRHPDTGAQISGRLVPLWRETMNLVERAHATLGNRVLIGWDVGILAEGPQIVEANASADLDIIQIIEDRPLGNERLGQLLAFHVERYLKDHDNAHSVA
jgi:hypothetical protein